MSIQGAFFGLDEATLTTLKQEWLSCLSAIAGAGQSYTIAGRQFNRANLKEVRDTLAEINAALDQVQGSRPTQTFMRVS